jgi:hypothetical protein
MFVQIFLIRQVVKLEVKKVEYFIIWDGGSIDLDVNRQTSGLE